MNTYVHARAPVRIGIAGGGTDLPAWANNREGVCVGLAIRMYTHAVAISRGDGTVVASYSRLDRATSATEIANGLIREAALMHGQIAGFEVHTLSEVSSKGSGLGTSSSIAVCVSAVFSEMTRIARSEPAMDPDAFRAMVARDAWEVEIGRLLRPIGRQDHMAAAWGALRQYSFRGDAATVTRTFRPEDADWVAKHLFLVRLPRGHDARTILSKVDSMAKLEAAYESVPIAVKAIESRDVKGLGEALWMGHRAKARIPGAIPSWLERIVSKIRRVPGVTGCKVAGAGGGGHLIVAAMPGATNVLAVATGLNTLPVLTDFDGVRVETWT